MTASKPEIIAYGYELAPNPQKLFHFLAFFRIPYKVVEIPSIMPRPMLADVGVTYRRTPLLSIGSDMYIDNALIVEKLSDIAQHSNSDLEDATNHLEFDALGQMAFRYGIGLRVPLVPEFRDPAFVADRSDLLGSSFEQVADFWAKTRPQLISKMRGLLNTIESHFLKDRKFFLGGSMPSTADMHLYWGLNDGLHGFAQPEISATTNPKIFEWLSNVTAFLEGRRSETKIDMAEAKQVLQSPPTHEYAKFVPHVKDNPEGFAEGQKIKVTPEDTGKNYPQFGELISLNYDQVCLRNEKGVVMHFPRMGYVIEAS